MDPGGEEPGRRQPGVDGGDEDAPARESGDEAAGDEKRERHEEVGQPGEGPRDEIDRHLQVEGGHRQQHEHREHHPRRGEGDRPRGSPRETGPAGDVPDPAALGEAVHPEPGEEEGEGEADDARPPPPR